MFNVFIVGDRLFKVNTASGETWIANVATKKWEKVS